MQLTAAWDRDRGSHGHYGGDRFDIGYLRSFTGGSPMSRGPEIEWLDRNVRTIPKVTDSFLKSRCHVRQRRATPNGVDWGLAGAERMLHVVRLLRKRETMLSDRSVSGYSPRVAVAFDRPMEVIPTSAAARVAVDVNQPRAWPQRSPIGPIVNRFAR
jgi:hypothetical protein